jgi:glutamine synthetase
MGFIEDHGLWTEQQYEAAAKALETIANNDIRMIRLSWPDQYGILRGKSLSVDALKSAFKNGSDITNGPFLLDTANGFCMDPFGRNMFSGTELAGVGNMTMVPDPSTFRILPWANKTGWLLADLYTTSGKPFPLSSRALLKRAVAELEKEGYRINAGLEVEFYLTRIIDPSLDVGTLGAPGVQTNAPIVQALNKGYSYLSENHLDEVDFILSEIRDNLLDVGLPLRSIEDEFAPSQFEITFDVLQGLDFADAMCLFRSATKQVARRHGCLASFMCFPKIPDFFPNGWHLHQSLEDIRTGQNVFVPRPGEPLSETGRKWVGGILANASAASSFTTMTINGYRRRRSNSLAPDRLSWAVDNRAAMARVIANPSSNASRVENRVGEPGNNPYLYLASQIYSGLDGLRRNLDPGPLLENPYDSEVPRLPTNLRDAVDALKGSDMFRGMMGDLFFDYWINLRQAEWARFTAAEGEIESQSGEVTDWEHREYFELL